MVDGNIDYARAYRRALLKRTARTRCICEPYRRPRNLLERHPSRTRLIRRVDEGRGRREGEIAKGGWCAKIRTIRTRIISKEFRGSRGDSRRPTDRSSHGVSQLFFLHVDITSRTGKLNSADARVRRTISSFPFRPLFAFERIL